MSIRAEVSSNEKIRMILDIGDDNNRLSLNTDNKESGEIVDFLIKKGYMQSLLEEERRCYLDYNRILYKVDFTSKGKKAYALARKSLDNLMKIREDREKECLTAEILSKSDRKINKRKLRRIETFIDCYSDLLKKLKEERDRENDDYKDLISQDFPGSCNGKELNCFDMTEKLYRNLGLIPQWVWECDEYDDDYHFRQWKKK